MKRELRSFRYDKNREAITRPDIAPARPRFDEAPPPPEPETATHRVLPPYPALRPHADEPTVQYAFAQNFTASPTRDTERSARSSTQRGANDAPSSATQHGMVSNIPPPSRRRVKAEGPRTIHVILLSVLTTLAAGGIGAGLGTGTFARLIQRLNAPEPAPPFVSASQPAPKPVPSATVTPVAPRDVRSAPAPAPVPAPRSVEPPSGSEAPASGARSEDVPVVRFEDLPHVEKKGRTIRRTRTSKTRR